MKPVFDINVRQYQPLPTPLEIRNSIPTTDQISEKVSHWRRQITDILFGESSRLLVIVGPCSIHDPVAGLEYARRLKALSDRIDDRIMIVMRAYFEKPRTSVGWKGLIMDPNLDGSCNLDLGLRKARSFLRDLIDIGLPTATELLDPITPQYIADLICWSAVGARTTESQIHRQMASGLSMPMGFKNTTSGNIEAAINAIKAASQPMTFMGINVSGLASEISTNGNPFCHIILRGGDSGANYSAADIEACLKKLSAGNLPASITIDCSHANSGKEADAQPMVFRDVLSTRTSGNPAIKALMLESNLFEGSQSLKGDPSKLRYGVSITDACLGWESTEKLLIEAYQKLA